MNYDLCQIFPQSHPAQGEAGFSLAKIREGERFD
jgi:hypothetical protein